MQMAQDDMARIASPSAVFELRLASSDPTCAPQDVRMEFSHDELVSFFTKLERIQTQIDALT